jgi:hypothetical protein
MEMHLRQHLRPLSTLIFIYLLEMPMRIYVHFSLLQVPLVIGDATPSAFTSTYNCLITSWRCNFVCICVLDSLFLIYENTGLDGLQLLVWITATGVPTAADFDLLVNDLAKMESYTSLLIAHSRALAGYPHK